MQITLETKPFAGLETDALVSYVFEGDDPIQGRIAEIDQAAGGLLKKLSKSGEFSGKPLEMTLIHAPAGLKATRLLLVGAGKREKFEVAGLRKLAGAALRYLKSRSAKQIAFLVREGDSNDGTAQSIVEGVVTADFETDIYKTDRKDKSVDSLVIVGYGDGERSSGEKGLSRGRIIAESQNFARELINEPSNMLTPRTLADKAAAMAKAAGLSVDILDEKKIAGLKMGALLSVAQGGPEPPRVIVITYTPANAKPGGPVLAFIGKAVTFDTGGISIKPADGMEKMKYDMAGGAAMIGTMRALAALKPNVKVVCVVPSTENMPGGTAQKPGDIQTSMSGKTIEVLNTDAEGRLILADAITYAKQNLGVTHMVDAATLTGAIVVALANVNVGVFGGADQAWTDKVMASAKAVGEKMWQMPMDDEYREFIKGSFADIQNIGSGKGGGSITGAWFIREFAGDTPWVHLDIAGTAWNDDPKPWLAKGPTGVAVRTLVHLAMSY
jgi:leucyl aminopeptidase